MIRGSNKKYNKRDKTRNTQREKRNDKTTRKI